MKFTRPIVFWIAMFAGVVAVVILLREVLLPFVAAMALAYLLDPVASRIERLGVNRLLATLAILIVIVVTIVTLLALTAPVVVGELLYLIERFPTYVNKLSTLTNDPSRPWVSKIIGEGLAETERALGELTTLASGWVDTFLREAWSGGRALISFISLAVVTPVVACYLIYFWNGMIAWIDNWVPPSRRDTVRSLAREIDDTISGFVRGQGTICLVLAVYYAAALWLIGLNHGVLIGIATGLLSFIPYIGTLLGLVISTCVAFAQFWPAWTPILLVPAVFFIGQAFADYVLAPYLIARRVHLNPVWVIFALFASGYLFGFVGLLIAMPLAAAIGVLLRFALRQYYASPLYAVGPEVAGGRQKVAASASPKSPPSSFGSRSMSSSAREPGPPRQKR